MNAKWTSWVVAGTLWAALSSPAVAQPWAAGDRGPGRGRMNQGPTAVRPQMGRTDPGAWCPMGKGPSGNGMGFSAFSERCARRLGLTDEQVQKLRGIVDEARSRTFAAIKEVLTEEQARQFEPMCPRASQFGRPGRGAAMQDDSVAPAGGPGFRQGRGRGVRMNADGWQPAGRSRGGRWNDQPGRWNNQPVDGERSPVVPQGGSPLPLIEQRFDEADANHDGTLTREEIRAFHDSVAPGRGRLRQ
jgi:Spy/CpxP family protein refolding chaperone